MNFNKLLRSYKQKLLLEGLLRSFLFGLIFSAAALFLASLVCRIITKEVPLWLLGLIGGCVFTASFLLLFIFHFYPVPKTIAARVDELGLQERVSTMLEYRQSDTEIAALQRKDAIEQISKISPKQMKFHFLKREFIVCAFSVCMAVIMMALPYNIFGDSDCSETPNDRQAQIINSLISQLHEETEDSKLDDELKEALNDITDELESELDKSSGILEQAALIEQSKQELDKDLEKKLTKNKIGDSLLKREITKPLGEAINDGDAKKISDVLDELEKSLNTNKSLVANLNKALEEALKESGVDSTDELYAALHDLSTTLSEMDTENDNFPEKLSSAFDNTEAAVLDALEKQKYIESKKDRLEELMSKSKDKILGNETAGEEEPSDSEQSDGEHSEGNTSDGEQSDGEQSDAEASADNTPGDEQSDGEQSDDEQSDDEQSDGEQSDGEQSEGNTSGNGQSEGNSSGGGSPGDSGDGKSSSMTEKVYDPISGNVSYGDVFAVYYAQYLAALEDGTVSYDLQEIASQYFSSLN